MNALPERLFELRKRKNMAQERTAEGCGISYNSSRRYESGERKPTRSVLLAIADYDGVSLAYLAGRESK